VIPTLDPRARGAALPGPVDIRALFSGSRPTHHGEVSRTILIADDPRFDQHRSAGPHPERPERLAAARAGLNAALGAEAQRRLTLRRASEEAIERVHEPGYAASLTEALDRGWGNLDPDTYFCPETAEATWLAAGAAADLGGALADAPGERAIALLRPPGHHARPSAPMGFCLINNVAVAAAAARAAGAERVAIVDWDVHHGNGTQEIFAADPSVLFISLHQHPFYPGTGAPTEIGRGAGRGSTVNVGFPAGTSSAAYGEAFRRVVLPRLEAFAPELVLVSAGFDAHERDPLAGLALEAQTFTAMATALDGFCADGRSLGLLLEGGYDLQALESSVAACAGALTRRAPVDLPEDAPRPRELEAIERTLAAHEE
jgi:acetoin utilization deacetylase AcuC-like enzyme